MTLTQTAILSKRFFIFFVLFLVLVVIGWISFKIYLASLPKPAAQLIVPTVKFGILPKPMLPESSASASNYNFSLDTDTGTLSKDTPQLAKVYATPQLGATLLAADRVKALAKRLGFDQGPQVISSNLHRFTNALGDQITINLDTGNFTLIQTEASPSAQQIAHTIDDKDTLATDFKTYLSGNGLLKPTLTSGKLDVNYNALAQIDSTQAFISLWPTNLDDHPIVTPTFNHGLINATFSKFGNDDQHYIKINYTYWEPDETNFATYSIKSPSVAFDELKNNLGVIVVSPPSSRASITKVELGYYEPNEYPIYIQPVYVFSGPSFAAYVPAITADYLAK